MHCVFISLTMRLQYLLGWSYYSTADPILGIGFTTRVDRSFGFEMWLDTRSGLVLSRGMLFSGTGQMLDPYSKSTLKVRALLCTDQHSYFRCAYWARLASTGVLARAVRTKDTTGTFGV